MKYVTKYLGYIAGIVVFAFIIDMFILDKLEQIEKDGLKSIVEDIREGKGDNPIDN